MEIAIAIFIKISIEHCFFLKYYTPDREESKALRIILKEVKITKNTIKIIIFFRITFLG